MENRISETETEMLQNATDFPRLAKLTEEKEELEGRLMEKMDRWEYLSELAEKIASYKK